MKYKLIVTDMDGTLLNSKGQVSDENKNVLKELNKKGIHVAIATGRIYTTVRVYAKHLGIVTPIICSNGSIVKNLEDNSIVYSNPLPIEYCNSLLDICKKNNINFYYFSEDTMYGEKLEGRLLYYSEWGKTLKEEERIHVKVVKDSRDIFKSDIIYKFGLQSDNDDILKSVAKEINSIMDVETHKSLANMLDIMNKDASKGKAIEKLAKSLGVKREEVLAIGDNENDMSMLEYAGLGIAMGNAEDKVKDIADFVTDSNDNNGVAKAINKFVLI